MPGEDMLMKAASAASGGGIQALIGAGEAAYSLINGSKLRKESERLDKARPKYNISPYASQDVSLAENQLASGMSGTAEKAYTEGIDKTFASSLNAIMKGGGSGNTVSGVFGNSEDGYRNLSMLKEANRMKQIDEVSRTHQYYNEQLDKEFAINKMNPWKDAKQANSAARQQNSNLLMSGIDSFGAGATSMLGGKAIEKQQDKYWGKPSMGSQQSLPSSGVNLQDPSAYYNNQQPQDTTDYMSGMNFDFLNDKTFHQ